MNRPLLAFMVAVLILLSGCTSIQKYDCLTPFAEEYCNELNLTNSLVAAEGEFIAPSRFWCYDERLRSKSVYYFTKEEIDSCN